MIPQCDPRANYLAHREEIDAAVSAVLGGGRYVLGEQVALFEEEFAAYMGSGHAIGVASGTDAVEIGLRACGVGPGDFVATVSQTAVATVAAIGRTGATPVFVDVQADRPTIDLDWLDELLESGARVPIRAIVPVHLYGQPVEMPGLVELARKHGVRVVEDCAQAHGAEIRGRKVGTWGDVGAFSFYPTKNLGALGDGGLVLTDDPGLAERIRMLRQYGWRDRHVSEFFGVNSRLDELQAAILRVKLQHLDEENDKRLGRARLYAEALRDSGVQLPAIAEDTTHVFHQFVIQTDDRDSLKQRLEEKEITTLIHYPVPVHQQPAFSAPESRPLPLRNTDRAVRRILSLPMYPELAVQDCERVSQCIRESL